MDTPAAMRALASGTTTGVNAPMKVRGTVTVTRRHGESCPFTVANDSGETKRAYKFRKIATAFQRARANTSANVEWSATV